MAIKHKTKPRGQRSKGAREEMKFIYNKDKFNSNRSEQLEKHNNKKTMQKLIIMLCVLKKIV